MELSSALSIIYHLGFAAALLLQTHFDPDLRDPKMQRLGFAFAPDTATSPLPSNQGP